MSIVNLEDILRGAGTGYAVPAFNILNELTANAVISCCEELASPVILQTSVSTVKQVGIERLANYLKYLAKSVSVPVAIHLDHCRDIDLAKSCAKAGWTSIMIDGSHLPLADNIELTRQIVGFTQPLNVSVEGEIGSIVGVEDDLLVKESQASLAKLDEAILFARQTGVTALAPAIGTAHGIYKGAPEVDFQLLEDIREAVGVPIVIHGGTGLSDKVFRKLISAGAAKINISTALKQAYLCAADIFLQNNTINGNPLNLDAQIERSVAEMVEMYVHLFSSSRQLNQKENIYE